MFTPHRGEVVQEILAKCIIINSMNIKMLLKGKQERININHYQNVWLFQLRRQCRVISNLSRNLTFPKLLRCFLLHAPLNSPRPNALHHPLPCNEVPQFWTASRAQFLRTKNSRFDWDGTRVGNK